MMDKALENPHAQQRLADEIKGEELCWISYHELAYGMIGLHFVSGKTIQISTLGGAEFEGVIPAERCLHRWQSARNEYISGGMVCFRCGVVRAKTDAEKGLADGQI